MASVVALGSVAGYLAGRKGRATELRWQIDPDKCIGCGNCATRCVLDESAVKCVQFFDMCGYCDICTGYFDPNYRDLTTAAENQMCPTGAVIRTFVEEKAGQRFYEYTIDADLCIGCGKCVKGCALMNGSLYLQVMPDRCRELQRVCDRGCLSDAGDRTSPRRTTISAEAVGTHIAAAEGPRPGSVQKHVTCCSRCWTHEKTVLALVSPSCWSLVCGLAARGTDSDARLPDHAMPTTQVPHVRSQIWQAVDVVLLLAALSCGDLAGPCRPLAQRIATADHCLAGLVRLRAGGLCLCDWSDSERGVWPP